MIIKNIKLKNKYLDVHIEQLNFDKNGIYLISGINGAGKTTLIKNIVFENNECIFENEEQQLAYLNNRGSLFSYVPQQINITDISILNYIKKDNELVKQEDITYYLDYFKVSQNKLSLNASLLSGGDKIKISFISAILKDTPYLFLDEPTNYLDDSSTEKLLSFLIEYSKNHTVIMVSHDPRVQLDNYNSIVFKGNTVFQSDNKGDVNNGNPISIKKKNGQKFINSILLKIDNIFSYIFFIILLLLIGIITLQPFYNNYYMPDIMFENKNIVVYKAEYEYPNLNENYINERRLKVDQNNYNRLVSIDDLKEIRQYEGVDNIYLFNDELINIVMDYKIDLDNNQYVSFSIPETICHGILEMYAMSDFLLIDQGNRPKDNANEIVMSSNMLKKIVNTNDPYSLIGSSIVFDGKEYTLSGISYFDMVWLSYGFSDSFFVSIDTNYEEIKEKLWELYSEYEYSIYPEFIIETNDDSGKLLDKIMVDFPANNYYSNIFGDVFIKNANRSFLIKIILFDTALSIIGAIFYILFSKMGETYNLLLLEDYNNYYLFGNNFVKRYYASKTIFLWFCCIIAAIIYYFINKDYPLIMGLIIYSGLMITLFVLLWRKIRKNVDKKVK